MKKALLSLAAAVLFGTLCTAQITLHNTDYPTILGTTDSVRVTLNATFPSNLTTGSNPHVWHLTQITYPGGTAGYSAIFHVPTPLHQFADSTKDTLVLSSNQALNNYFIYKTDITTDVTGTGIKQFGQNIPQQGYSLSAAPNGTSTDSLIISAQVDTYSSPRMILPFPATNGATWTSNYHYSVTFQLTFAAAGFSHSNITKKSYVVEQNNVTGYGTMNVNKPSNLAPTIQYNVLQVRTNYQTSDSFFVNGAPIDNLTLMLMGLSQGHSTVYYEQNYYRTGEITPLAKIVFDPTYTTPFANNAQIHSQRLTALGINNIPLPHNISVYPNPVRNSMLNIDMPEVGAGHFSYDLVNITGQVVATDKLPNTTHTQVTLPRSLTAGIYYLVIRDNGEQIAVKPLDIAE